MLVIIIVLLGIVLAIAAIIMEINDKPGRIIVAFAAGAFLCLGIIMIDEKDAKTHPTALDVYRDKTTLEITFRDSVAIDSVVVFKNK